MAQLTSSGLFIFLRKLGLTTLGTAIVAFAFVLFMKHTNIAPGGVLGIALIANELTGLSVGMISLGVMLPTLAIGYMWLGRLPFLASAWYVTLLYGFFLEVLPLLGPEQPVTNDLWLNTLYGGILGGLGLGLIYHGGANFAGTGVISRIIQLRTGLPVSTVYMLVDGVIIIGLGLFFGWENALYAFIMLFVWGLATDYCLEGPSVVKSVFIITTKPEEVSRAIINELGIGVTAWACRGMYSGAEKTTLLCTLIRPEVASIKTLVSAIDTGAFLVINHGHHARGGRLRKPIPKPIPRKPMPDAAAVEPIQTLSPAAPDSIADPPKATS